MGLGSIGGFFNNMFSGESAVANVPSASTGGAEAIKNLLNVALSNKPAATPPANDSFGLGQQIPSTNTFGGFNQTINAFNPSTSPLTPSLEKFHEIVKQQEGKPYSMGASSTGKLTDPTHDCSSYCSAILTAIYKPDFPRLVSDNFIDQIGPGKKYEGIELPTPSTSPEFKSQLRAGDFLIQKGSGGNGHIVMVKGWKNGQLMITESRGSKGVDTRPFEEVMSGRFKPTHARRIAAVDQNLNGGQVPTIAASGASNTFLGG